MKNGFLKGTDSQTKKLPHHHKRQSTSKSGAVAAHKKGRRKSSRSGWGRRKKKRADSLALAIVCLILFGSIIAGIIYLCAQDKDTIKNLDTSSQQRFSSVELDFKENAEKETNDSLSLLSNKLQDILNKHWEAMGGMRNWSKVESIRLNGTIEHDGQIVDICIVKKRPNRIRATVNFIIAGSEDKELQIIRAHDGKTAWTATRLVGTDDGMVKEELPKEAADELLADASVLPPLIKIWRERAAFELTESQVINGEETYSLKTKHAHPVQYVFYLSKINYQLLAYDSIKPDATSTRTSITDYIEKAGILIPRSSVIASPSSGIHKITINSVELGVGIFNEYFAPGEVLRAAQLD